jgi:hypothetical protein
MMQNNENAGKPALKLVVNKKNYDWPEQYITGGQIREIAEITGNHKLYLRITEPWDDELIFDDTRVNLAREGIEDFYTAENLKFMVDGKLYDWPEQFITGKQIRKVAGIDSDDKIFLDNKKPYVDNQIEDDEQVDLARPSIERFYTVIVKHDVTIYVNGTEHKVDAGDISYARVVTFAFPDYAQHPEKNYSVKYRKGHGNKPEGILLPGQSVKVKDQMIFNVSETGQS